MPPSLAPPPLRGHSPSPSSFCSSVSEFTPWLGPVGGNGGGGGGGEARPPVAVAPSNEGRRRKSWNHGASTSSSFSSGSSAICRRLPSPPDSSPIPGAPGDCSDAIATDAAAAAAAAPVGVAEVGPAGGKVVVVEGDKGPAIRLTSAVLESPEHQRRQPRVGAVSPTWKSKSGRLYDSVTSDNQEGGGGGGGTGDDGKSYPSRPSALSAAAKAAAAKAADARGQEAERSSASLAPSLGPATPAPASAPPCYEEALARSAVFTRSMIPPVAAATAAVERAEAPEALAATTATKRVAQEECSSGSDSETTTVGGGKGVKVARQMWERRASSVGELQDGATGSPPRGSQAFQRGGGRRESLSSCERRPSAGTGAGSGVANMKVQCSLW